MQLRNVFLNPQERLRAVWRILIYIAITAACAQIALWLYFAAGGLSPRSTITGPAGELVPMVWLYLLLCAAGLLGAFIMLRFIDRRSFAALGYGFHNRTATEIAEGLAGGFGLVTITFAAEWLFGWARVDWHFAAGRETALAGGMYFAMFGLAAALEEIVARGYILQVLILGTGKIVAVGIMSILFGLGHVINPHAGAFSLVNTIVAGLWLSIAYLKTRSLWLPTSLHLAWNFSLAFVYGFPVSGLSVSQSIVRLEQRGPHWITGGSYGPEAGALGLVVIILGVAWVCLSRHVRPAARATSLWDEPPVVPESQ
jgi:membrane protease YdiL (CAAX protease family)